MCRNYSEVYVRYAKYSVNEIREAYEYSQKMFQETGKWPRIEFGDHKVKLASDRYQNFFENGTECIQCGIKGEYFWLETDSNKKGMPTDNWHFNLYGTDDNGKEMMLTKDHIKPKSKGGKNHVSNYQCMCERCNHKKADKYEEG